MSIVTYKVGEGIYSFSTKLQIKQFIDMLALETLLIDEIKNHKKDNGIEGIIHDVTIKDDSGLTASAKDFRKPSVSLELKNVE